MRLLLTSDWQTELDNLNECEQALEELLNQIPRCQPDAVIHCGDLKESYNPLDLRVPKFWIKAIPRIIATGRRFIVLLGNHDRISQSVDSRDWLDILRTAGAETVRTPKWKEIGDGLVAFLPYTPDKKKEAQWAELLFNGAPVDKPRALIFHTEVEGGLLDNGFPSKGISPKDLWAIEYDVCLGGHFHHHQQVADKIWYVGSPFCQSWGEANQTKGHVLVDISRVRELDIRSSLKNPSGVWKRQESGFYVRVRQLKTSIPGWYTSDYLKETGKVPEKGAYIRSKVEVTSRKITDQLRREEKELAKLYPQAMILVIPNIREPESLEVSLAGSTDREQIESYVASTLPDNCRFHLKQAVSYLSHKLPSSSLKTKSIRFLSADAENVLTFQHVKAKYAKQGLVLLRGRNLDWPKRSNGAGKTNFLSLLPVALFGETLKEQRNDAWASEWTDDPARISITLRDERNRLIKVSRHRPHKLILEIDGKDQSSGLTGKSRRGQTQGLLEEAIGLDLKTLKNSVYIDQTIANGFVFGTNKDRMDLVAKLQNLERFEVAQKLIAQDIKNNESALTVLAENSSSLESSISEVQEQLEELDSQVEKKASADATELRKALVRLTEAHAGILGTKPFYDALQREIDDLRSDINQLRYKSEKMYQMLYAWNRQLKVGQKLIESGKCSLCGQPSQVAGNAFVKRSTTAVSELTAKKEALDASIAKLDKEILAKGFDVAHYQDNLIDAEYKLSVARASLEQAERSERDEQERNSRLSGKKATLTHKLKLLTRKLKAVRENIKQTNIDRELLEYCKKAVSRDGMPLYLSAALCPVLNKASEEYADIFYDGAIRAHFAVVDGEFTVSVVNPVGSNTATGQSEGEKAMAGVIAAFAVRETAPKTNLLVMDEPGHGLDPEGARRFARGLLKLKDRFSTMILTTHSPIIESVLSGETVWTVTKQKGISTLAME